MPRRSSPPRTLAAELERRWNEALQTVCRLEGEIAALAAKRPLPLGEKERQELMQLGADLERAWAHPAATPSTRKRILRAVLHEIVVRVESDQIELILHWQGGDHTALKVKKNGVGKHRWTIAEDTLSIVRGLARLMPDKQNCAAPQSRRQADRTRQWLDLDACHLLPQSLRHWRPSCGRMGRARRAHA